MSLFAIAVAVGLSVGYARGGRLGRLGHLRLRAPVLAGLALALQAGAGLAPPSSRPVLVAVSYGLVGTWLALNVGRRPRALRLGIGLLALGWLLNGAAMVPHGGMPVSAAAMESAGFRPAYDVTDGHLFKHVADDRQTPVDWLGDVIPVRSLGAVISIGDLALLAGIALCVGAAMLSSASGPVSGEGRQGAARRSSRTVQAPGSDVGGLARHRRRHRAWREPAPPGDDGGATIFDPHVALATCGIALREGATS